MNLRITDSALNSDDEHKVKLLSVW